MRVLAGGVGELLEEEISADVAEEALTFLRDPFSEPSRPGSRMAARAAVPSEAEATISLSCAVLTQDLLRAVEGH